MNLVRIASRFIATLLLLSFSSSTGFALNWGVKLACEGSAVVESLRALEKKGTRLILCRTCLDYFGLMDKVAVGSVGKMTDIVAAMEAATKVACV